MNSVGTAAFVAWAAGLEAQAHAGAKEAAPVFERCLELYRRAGTNSLGRTECAYYTGRWEEAHAAADSMTRRPRIWDPGPLGPAAARLGLRDEAEQLMESLPKRWWPGVERVALLYFHQAWIAIALGQRERALELLSMMDRPGVRANLLHTNADFEPLRGDPVFEAMLRLPSR